MDRRYCCALGIALLLTACTPAPPTEKAEVDAGALSDHGVVTVRYTGGAQVRIKVQLLKEDGTPYNYDLNNAGEPETFALTEGNGTYTLSVLENIEGARYQPVYSEELTLDLTDDTAPFRVSNQFVSYTADSEAAQTAARLAEETESPAELVWAVLDYVADHLSYDQVKAETVESGYLPDVDRVLAEGKGICFDYAALMAAMLRSQDLPCRLVVGYAGTVYHAWVEVYSETPAQMEELTLREGWTRLDPTFVSTSGRSPEVWRTMADDSRYQKVYCY